MSALRARRDDRIDDIAATLRALAPLATTSAVHTSRLDDLERDVESGLDALSNRLLERLDDLKRDVHTGMDALSNSVVERIAERDERIDDRLDAIVEQTTTTNGRLRKAELWIAGAKAVMAFLAATGTVGVAVKLFLT